jgi:hypothetical protein
MAKLTLARKGRCKIMMMHQEQLHGAIGKFKTQDFYKCFQQWRNNWTYHLAGEIHQMQQQLYARTQHTHLLRLVPFIHCSHIPYSNTKIWNVPTPHT